MRRIAPLLVTCGLFLAPGTLGVARAQEPGAAAPTPEQKKEAQALLKEASEHAKDKDPAKCRELAEKAYGLDPTHLETLAFLAWLYDIKLGEADKSIEFYDKAIRTLIGAKERKELRYKADLIARKADVLYASKDDLEGAAQAYQASLDTYKLSSTADKLSNLFHRLAGQTTDAAKKKERDEKALKYAQLALELAPYGTLKPEQQKHWLAKVKVQLALCNEVLGNKDAAKKALDTVDPEDWDDSCLYNQALLDAFRGDGQKAANRLRDYMKSTRPTARARNQLRRVIRTEPDFAKFKDEASWKDIVTDEPAE